MSRYIDSVTLKVSTLRYAEKLLSHKRLPITKKVAEEVINDVCFAIDVHKSVDAVPVVRCRDCKHKDVLPDLYGIGNEALYCPVIKHYVKHDFFCKYGEKVTEDVII